MQNKSLDSSLQFPVIYVWRPRTTEDLSSTIETRNWTFFLLCNASFSLKQRTSQFSITWKVERGILTRLAHHYNCSNCFKLHRLKQYLFSRYILVLSQSTIIKEETIYKMKKRSYMNLNTVVECFFIMFKLIYWFGSASLPK